MSSQNLHTPPLVSVIIPCYNHGQYLAESIASVQAQDYPRVETIVVDDGSTDNTREIAEKFQGVKYIHQPNQGLSAARNTGIEYSSGEMLIFLDADDWLLPRAISTNLRYLQENPEAAFVSGAHEKVFVDTRQVKEKTPTSKSAPQSMEDSPGVPSDRLKQTFSEESSEITQNHYVHLLQGNYIGMHAAVMYRRRVFEEFSFDTSLRSCEDYDLYLKIARQYPVLHHTKKIAAYRLHSANMSGNIPFMLKSALEVLDRQQAVLNSPEEKQAFRHGHAVWKDYYGEELYLKLRHGKAAPTRKALATLLRYKPYLLLKYLLTKLTK